MLVVWPQAYPVERLRHVARRHVLCEGSAHDVRRKRRLHAGVVCQRQYVRLVGRAQRVTPVQQCEQDLVGEGRDDGRVRQMAHRRLELQVVEVPDALDEGPEALLQVHVPGKLSGYLGRGVMRRREVFEQVENQAVLVVERDLRVHDALVQVPEAGVAFGRIHSAPCSMACVNWYSRNDYVRARLTLDV